MSFPKPFLKIENIMNTKLFLAQQERKFYGSLSKAVMKHHLRRVNCVNSDNYQQLMGLFAEMVVLHYTRESGSVQYLRMFIGGMPFYVWPTSATELA